MLTYDSSNKPFDHLIRNVLLLDWNFVLVGRAVIVVPALMALSAHHQQEVLQAPDPSRTAVVANGSEWNQGRTFTSRELTQSNGTQAAPMAFFDNMDPGPHPPPL